MSKPARTNLKGRLDRLEQRVTDVDRHIERHAANDPEIRQVTNDFRARVAKLKARIEAEDEDHEVDVVTPDTGPFAEVDNLEDWLDAFFRDIDSRFSAPPGQRRKSANM